MAQKKAAKKATKAGKTITGWTDAEREAMKERVKEMKASGRPGRRGKAEREAAVLAAIAAMPEPYRSLGHRIHALIRRSAPSLQPTTWYGMPAYAKDGKVVCFFKSAHKFKEKYSTFGLTDKANFAREEGQPDQLLESAWFFTALDDATEAKLADIVRRAGS